MESNKIAIAALLFIILIVGINFAMLCHRDAKGGEFTLDGHPPRLAKQTHG